jgi:hypothetical protein
MNKRILLMLLLLALLVPARVADVDQFATIDEPWWVISGSNFYYALTHREFANTSYDYHPAVTTMWVVTAGMVSYFPEYRVFNQGYFDVRKPLFENFMRDKGMDARPLLRNSRLIQIAIIAVLALLSFFLLCFLIDEKAAFLAIALALNAPFFTGHSRLLNHEAMLAMFSLVTLLAMQVYLNKERRLVYLLISGAAFGLAQLTKSSSIVLLPLVGLMLLVSLRAKRSSPLSFGDSIMDAIKTFLIWFAIAAFVYVLLWPGMWVAPLKMLNDVYGNAFSYALQGARPEIVDNLPVKELSLMERVTQVKAFATQWINNSTPLSWLGLICACAFFLPSGKKILPAPLRSTLVYLFSLAALVILLFSVSSGRDSSHYILTSYVSLDVMAGIGLGYFFLWLQTKRDALNRAFFLPLIFSALLIFQLGSSLLRHPYYFTYQNPFVAWGGTHGYGEGLDLAADYLAQKPNAKDSYVIVYAGRGCFSYFYPGRTEHMKIGIKDDLPFIEDVQNADYFVVYDIYQKAKPDGQVLIGFLKDVPPEHIVTLDDREYARIYKVSDLPENIYKTLLVS